MGFAFCQDGVCRVMFKLQNHPPSWPEISLGCQDVASLKTKLLCSSSLRNRFCTMLWWELTSGSGYPTSPVGFSCPCKAGRHLSNVNIPMEILHTLGWKKPSGCFLTNSRQCLTLLRPDAVGLRIFIFKRTALPLDEAQVPRYPILQLECAISDRKHKMQGN